MLGAGVYEDSGSCTYLGLVCSLSGVEDGRNNFWFVVVAGFVPILGVLVNRK